MKTPLPVVWTPPPELCSGDWQGTRTLAPEWAATVDERPNVIVWGASARARGGIGVGRSRSGAECGSAEGADGAERGQAEGWHGYSK